VTALESPGGLSVSLSYPAGADHVGAVRSLVAEQVASRITGQDPTLWGPAAEAESSIRLSWVGLAETSRPLVAAIEALRAELAEENVDHVVLAGMGGSSLAPEVICATAGVELATLDTTDAGQVSAAIADRLDRTVLVVSSKSGGRSDSHRRALRQGLRRCRNRCRAPNRRSDRSRLAARRRGRGGEVTARRSRPTRTSAAGTAR
jgi:glucose-6-phosphate isomerase